MTPSPPPDAPVVIVHSLVDALRALRTARKTGRRIVLASAEGAGAYAGPLWFRELAAAAAAEEGGALQAYVVDCGPYPGPVMEGLDLGITHIRFTGPRRLAKKLKAMAEARGAEVITRQLKAFDTLDKGDLEADLEAWLRARP